MSIRFTTVPEEADAITHGGNFHADDIFSMVLLEKVFGNITVYRCPINVVDFSKINPNAIIFDIGYGKFDHHQENGNGNHPNNDPTKLPIPYASFGLLWKEYGKTLCDKLAHGDPKISNKIWNHVEHRLVIGVDACDNGIYPYTPAEYARHRVLTVSFVISLLTPNALESEDFSIPLEKAISFARLVFDVCIDEVLSNFPCDYHDKVTHSTRRFTAQQLFVRALAQKCSITSASFSEIQDSNITNNVLLIRLAKSNYVPIPFSELGVFWSLIGPDYCRAICKNASNAMYVWNFINTHLVVGIDAIANNIRPLANNKYASYTIWTLFNFIESLACRNAQELAMQIATLIFERLLNKVFYRLQSREYVEQKILESKKYIPAEQRTFADCSKHILVFEKHVHWQDWLFNTPGNRDIWFVISPSNTGGYIIQPVSDNNTKNGYRKGFPRKWHGLNGEALQKVTKVPDATFIHYRDGFIGGANSLEGAVKLAQRAFSNTECALKENRKTLY